MKNSLLTFALLSLFAFQAKGQISFNWLGTTNLALNDGDTTILFDPFVTRAGILNLLFSKEIDSDPRLAQRWIKKADIGEISAIFISHSHWDHLLDLAAFMRAGRPLVYGTQSTKNFALGNKIGKDRIKAAPISVSAVHGSFSVSARKTKHAPHIFGLNFIEGKIKKPLALPATMWEMKEGASLTFHIKHPLTNILFHPSAIRAPGADYTKLKAEVLFLGIANRESVQAQIKHIIRPSGAKIVVPVHHDNLFTPLEEEVKPSFFAKLEEWEKDMKELAPDVKVIIPKIAEWTVINSGK